MVRTDSTPGAGAAATPPRARLALVAFFLLSLPLVTARIYASDEVQYFSFLRSLWFDHDLSFENEYQHFYDAGIVHTPGFHETFLERRTETGRRLTFGTIGCALLWMPFYALGDMAARVLGAIGRPVPLDGYSYPYVAAVCYASAVYGFAAVWLSALAADRVLSLISPRPRAASATRAALAVWLGTPLLFYMYVAPPMSHALSAFTVSAFVLAWIHLRRHWSPRGLVLLGGLGALMAMVREQDALFLAGPAIDFVWTLWRREPAGGRSPAGDDAHAVSGRRLVVGVVGACIAFAIAYLPQAIAYVVLNGHLGPSTLVTRKMTWTAPHALQVLMSPEHGFFVWTPLTLFGLAGLILLACSRSATSTSDVDVAALTSLAVSMLIAIAAQVYIAGSVESWTVAGAFGQRRFVAITPLLVVGLAALWDAASPRWRPALVAGVIGCVWWNVGLIAQFGLGLMDRQRLEIRQIAYNNAVVIPRRLPEIAYRYGFDRRSFYKTPGPQN